MTKETTPKPDGKDEAEHIVAQIQKKLTDAFDVFDGDKTRSVDVKEVPTIIHSLNLVPTQGEMRDLITEMEDGDNSDIIKYEKFTAVMTDVLVNKKFKPANENKIYKALQVLDTENKGYYTKEDLIRMMTTEGEPLNAEEMNEMLQTCSAFIDPESAAENPKILYKYYINELVVEDTKD
ncbi:unnamed protein product [Brachionus calyciflorus]|uniref:EF-hand domain-containing protein n=1 Tax=Brachionus calyciflorus TaxID=104777 RepID=A0A813M2L4_9BILA|nr:unnamed protein product [Brachionus calyciflorus]